MNEALIKFLKKVLGDEGAVALQKAAARHTGLASALPARGILSWLMLTSRWGYDGSIPGIENSFLSFQKSGDDLFDGFVEVSKDTGPEVYEFKNASILHIAAATSVALGVDVEPDPTLKSIDVTRLGKNIDILVMSRFINLAKQSELSAGEESTMEKEEFETGGVGKPLKPKSPTEPEAPVAKEPARSAKLKMKTLAITKSQAEKECEVCGEPQINSGKLSFCYCLRDLAEFTKSSPTDTGYVLELSDEWTNNDLSVFIDMIQGA